MIELRKRKLLFNIRNMRRLMALLSFLAILNIQAYVLENACAQETRLSSDDLAYLKTLERATFSGFEKLFEKTSGLPIDIASVESGNVRHTINDHYRNKTSPTNVGLGFLYLILARDRGYMAQEEVYVRAIRMMDTLESLESYNGFLYNWYYLSGEKEVPPRVVLNRFVSSLDNGDLDICLMASAGAFPNMELASRIEKVLQKKDYHFFLDKNPYRPHSGMINAGYDEEKKTYAATDYSILNVEGRMTALVAILKDNVPDTVWKEQSRLVRSYKTTDGENILIVAPWGGSLYETLFADEIIGGSIIAPKAFGQNAVNMIKIHIDKGKIVSKSGIWGFSNGEVPGEDRYEMAGVQEIAYNQFPGRFVTPYSSFLALRYNPKAVVDNLKRMETLNPKSFNSNYGFTDSIDPITGTINSNILSLDKGMEVLAIGNFMNRLEGKMDITDYLWKYLKMKELDKKAESLIKAEENNQSFIAISRNTEKESNQNPVINQKSFIDLLKIYTEIGAFYEPGRAKASFRKIDADDAIEAEYDVRKRYSYSGIYLKFNDLDVLRYRRFRVEIKGDETKGFPASVKMELKYHGQYIQFGHIPLKGEWSRSEIPMPMGSTKIDEVTLVFENSSAGKHPQGTIKLRLMRLE